MSFTNGKLPSTESSSPTLELKPEVTLGASSSSYLEEITTRMSQIPFKEELDHEPEELDYEPEEFDLKPKEGLEFDDFLIPAERSPSPILPLDPGLLLSKTPFKSCGDLASISSKNYIVKNCSVPMSECSNSGGASSADAAAISPSVDQQSAPKITFNPKSLISTDDSDPKVSQHSSGGIDHPASASMNDCVTANVGNGEPSRALPEPRSSRLERRLIITSNQAKGASGSDGSAVSPSNDQKRKISRKKEERYLSRKISPKISFDPKSLISADDPDPRGSQLFTDGVDHRVSVNVDVCETANVGNGEPSNLTESQSSSLKRHLIVTDEEAGESQIVSAEPNLAEPVISFGNESTQVMSPELCIWRPKVTLRCSTSTSDDVETQTTQTSGIDLEAFIKIDDSGTIPLSPVLPMYPRKLTTRGFADSNATNETAHHTGKDDAPESGTLSVGLSKVTFNPSSLILADSCEIKTSPNASVESITYLPEDLTGNSENPPPAFGSPILLCGSSGGNFPKKNTDACTKINTDSDSRGYISQPEITSKRTTHLMAQQQSIKVNFSPSSLIFTNDPLPMADTNLGKSTHDLTSGSLENSKVTTQRNKVSFDVDELGITEMDDELTEKNSKTFKPDYQVVSNSTSYGLHSVENSLAPPNKPRSILKKQQPQQERKKEMDDELTEKYSKRFKPDHQVVSNSTSGLHSVENSLAPPNKPRSILKKQQPQQESANENIVSECLNSLCKTASGDKHQTYSLICRSASEVFSKLCFEQFFQKGECFSSSCDENHHYKPHIFPHPNDQLWYASIYVISHAAQPNLRIVENLIQHYATKGNTIKTLVFAKCIARVRDTDRLELAHYIINMLSGIIPRRDIITVILMMNFSELSTFQFNLLMEGLGVFEQNTTHYSELMAFLNFRGCLIPVRPLVKLMDDAIDYLGCRNNMVESISGFLGRLPSRQMEEVQSIARKFFEKFGISLDRNYGIGEDESNKKVIKAQKRKIQFAAEPHIREFEVSATPQAKQCDEPVIGEFSDDEQSDNGELEKMDFYDSTSLRTDAIVRVFGESCCTWILTGECPDPICRLIHDFTKDSLVGLPSEDVYVAADFVANQATNPSIEILKIFIEFLAESNETARVLQFRKCASKLSTDDSLALTNLVISLLAQQIGHWEAIQKVMVPDVFNSGESSDDNQFFFDHKLIQSVMSEAVSTKTSLMKCVTHAILQRVVALPPSDQLDFIVTTSEFMQKFIAGRNLPPYPNTLPLDGIQLEKFGSHLQVALYQGVRNKYFLATAMLKLAICDSLRDQALDVLYTFLLSNYDRARVLTKLLENCRYFDANDKKSVIDLLGAVGLRTIIRLYEGENIKGTAELLNVLKTFKFDIFSLLESHGNMTELNLAIIYCSVIADSAHRNETIDVFLKHCVGATVTSPVCPPELVKLTAKMFRVFTSTLSVEESFKLYNGIIAHQTSLQTPLNIVDYVEPTLRCAFHRSCDDKLRRETLKLYLDVIDSGSPIGFQKVTHRSVFLLALMEITHATMKAQVKGYINIIHPLVKKILMKCISEGAYPEFSSAQITLFSSMSEEEIRVYVLWWFFLFVRARKRQSIDYFPSVKIAIVQDCIQDDSRLPVHHSLRFVSVSITDCAERLALFVREAIPEPLPPYGIRGRGLFELDPSVVQGLAETSINLMAKHGYIDSELDYMCTFCFDKLNVNLADKL